MSDEEELNQCEFRLVKDLSLDFSDLAIDNKADYYFSLDADAHLTSASALKQLIRRLRIYDIRILAPMLIQPGKLFSNFWGAVSSTGFYARSEDYVEIAEKKRQSYWNVPFVNYAYLVDGRVLSKIREAFWFDRQIDADMSFAKFCRQFVSFQVYSNPVILLQQHFMYVDNQEEYGFLVESDFFGQINEHTIHREVYDYPNNKKVGIGFFFHQLNF
jgi:hypothetical protein